MSACRAEDRQAAAAGGRSVGRMISRTTVALLSVLSAAAPALGDPSPPLFLERSLLDAGEAGSEWSVVEETPVDTAGDPDLVEWGVRAQRTRHYTRRSPSGEQVCSIELWSFASVAQADVAHVHLAYPDWQILREGPLLVMIRSLTRAPGVPPRRTLFADCAAMGEKVRARAAGMLRP